MSFIRLHDPDNVAAAAADLPTGTHLADLNVTLANDIPTGHKFAITPSRMLRRAGARLTNQPGRRRCNAGL